MKRRWSGTNSLEGDLIPDADNTRNLGSSLIRFANVYAINLQSEVILVEKTGATVLLKLNGDAGQWRSIEFHSSNSRRWAITADSSAEGGGNAGSDLQIRRYDDTDSYLSSPILIERDTGLVKFPDGIAVDEISGYSGSGITVKDNIIPDADNSRDIGSSSNRIRYFYAVHIDKCRWFRGQSSSANLPEIVLDNTGSGDGGRIEFQRNGTPYGRVRLGSGNALTFAQRSGTYGDEDVGWFHPGNGRLQLKRGLDVPDIRDYGSVAGVDFPDGIRTALSLWHEFQFTDFTNWSSGGQSGSNRLVLSSSGAATYHVYRCAEDTGGFDKEHYATVFGYVSTSASGETDIATFGFGSLTLPIGGVYPIFGVRISGMHDSVSGTYSYYIRARIADEANYVSEALVGSYTQSSEDFSFRLKIEWDGNNTITVTNLDTGDTASVSRTITFTGSTVFRVNYGSQGTITLTKWHWYIEP